MEDMVEPLERRTRGRARRTRTGRRAVEGAPSLHQHPKIAAKKCNNFIFKMRSSRIEARRSVRGLTEGRGKKIGGKSLHPNVFKTTKYIKV